MSKPKFKFTFECTECGDCCRRPGYIHTTKRELDTISFYTGVSVESLKDTFSGNQEGACQFLKRNKCSIHAVKPFHCASFPYWPKLSKDAGTLFEADYMCEGFKVKRNVKITDGL